MSRKYRNLHIYELILVFRLNNNIKCYFCFLCYGLYLRQQTHWVAVGLTSLLLYQRMVVNRPTAYLKFLNAIHRSVKNICSTQFYRPNCNRVTNFSSLTDISTSSSLKAYIRLPCEKVRRFSSNKILALIFRSVKCSGLLMLISFIALNILGLLNQLLA